MADVVGLDLVPGPEFVDAVRAAWDDGAAVLPLDPTQPPAARARTLAALAPGVLIARDGRRIRLADGRPTADGDALVVATSGTTGVPKGVVLTHDAVTASARATTARLAIDPTRHRWLACLPLHHIGGLSVLTRALITGTPIDVHAGFDALAVTNAATAGVTHVSLVATALGRIDPSLFETVLLGGARPPETLPDNVVTTYGMTETGSGIVYDGRPLDGVDLDVTPQGSIRVRGPMLLRSYRDGTDPLHDGWFTTGDRGHLVDGRLVVDGRTDDLIITGGENVWPDPVEDALRVHRKVAEAAITGRDDPEWGQRVVAHVVPIDPNDPPTLTELRDVVADVLPVWHAPKDLVLHRRLPRTASGKLRRSAID